MYKYLGLKYILRSIWYVIVLVITMIDIIFFGIISTICIIIVDFNYTRIPRLYQEIHSNESWYRTKDDPTFYQDNNPIDSFKRRYYFLFH